MVDYHTHTSFSDDSCTPMKEMIETACRIGVKEIAITDHYDPQYPDRNFPFEIDFPAYHNALNSAKETYSKRIKVVKGLEIGIQHGSVLEDCRRRAREFDYDFILGSFHCAEGYDLCSRGFYVNRSVEDYYLAFYTYVRDCLLHYKDYDVLGHINVIDRYASKIPAPSVYMDLVEEILKIIIADGKGIEINTSSFRYGMGERTTPAKEILQLYRDLGGEIVTVGSDAHRASDIGDHLDYAREMLRSAGLAYLAVFDQRKPSFIKIDSI